MGKKFFLIFLGILVPLSIAFALEIDWPPSPLPLGIDLTTTSTLTELSRYLYEWGIALGGLAAFIALLIAGFLYLTSVGDPQKLADARGRIIWALAGLVLLLAAWLILNTINPDLTRISLEGLLPTCDCDEITIPCSDCPTSTPPYICIGDPIPGDGNKQGICMSPFTVETLYFQEGPPCRYARVFAREFFDYGGANEIANFNENVGLGLLGVTDIRSIKSFYDDGGACATSTPQAVCAAVIDSAGNRLCDWNPDATTTFNTNCFRDCGPSACGCRAELYDIYNAGVLFPCWDLLGHTPANEETLVKYSEESSLIGGDGDVDCVILRKRSF